MDEEDVAHIQRNSAMRKKASLPFAPTHVNLEDGMLRDINQTEKYDVIPLVCETRGGGTDGNRVEWRWPGPWAEGQARGDARLRAACGAQPGDGSQQHCIRCLNAARNVDRTSDMASP